MVFMHFEYKKKITLVGVNGETIIFRLIFFFLKKKKKNKNKKKWNLVIYIVFYFYSSCSDSGSDEQKIQYILTDETESFEFNPEYLCKDLLQKNEYIAIVELSPK